MEEQETEEENEEEKQQRKQKKEAEMKFFNVFKHAKKDDIDNYKAGLIEDRL